MRRRTNPQHRRAGRLAARTTAVALLVLAPVTACGQAQQPGGGSSTPRTSTPAPTSTVVDTTDELVASGLLMQDSPTSPVELCVGGVAESYPPQCGGPRLDGDVDWEALRPQRASGVTWTEGAVWVVGRYSPATGRPGSAGGTVTLTRPVSLTPPAGVTLPSESPVTFPQLCDDPYAGGGRRGAGSPEEQAQLSERLTALDGYVGSWVSDGSSMFNVLVTRDAAAARAELRRVWPGGLCVEQRDLPTEADVRAAQDALATRVPGLLGSGGDAMNGRLDVQVTVLDAPTRDLILTTVRPWLSERDVRIMSAFQPLSD
ncbi:hypothetical protein LL946_08370 [Knoellia locipacati]|uniref:hypothetical protein n=1 Tax=Knoellia locipacati TaxID=882824 RepID=UPI00384B4811